MDAFQFFQQTPIMLYVSVMFLPVMIFGLFSLPKGKKVSAKKADPAEALKDARVNPRREFLSALFFGGSIAFGLAILIFLGDIIGDYKNSRGVFARALPLAAIPPAFADVLPPAPEVDGDGNIIGENSIVAPQEKSGFLF